IDKTNWSFVCHSFHPLHEKNSLVRFSLLFILDFFCLFFKYSFRLLKKLSQKIRNGQKEKSPNDWLTTHKLHLHG
ncbi:hypothetical protein B1K96_36220, partial [Escherichia coli]